MADLPLDIHMEAAASLYAQRRRLLERPWFDAGSLERLERRLKAHLATACDLGADAMEPPERRDSAFVHWACRLLADPERFLPVLLESLQAPGVVAEGARDALMLFPSDDVPALAAVIAGSTSGVRATFLRACAASGAGVPDALLNTVLAADDDDSRAAALEVAAVDSRRDQNFFRRWFPTAATGTADNARCTAIFAGLLRGDPEATPALAPALEHAGSDVDARRVLHLMALSGAPAHQDTLALYARREPKWGVPLLALHGAPALLETLLDLLPRQEAAESAVTAWWRMTGEVLPQRPRLRLVGQADVTGGGEMPDAEWAAGWLEAHHQRLAASPRLLFGDALGQQALAVACHDWAGAASADLLRQARLSIGPALRVHEAQWIILRRRRLHAVGLRNEPAIPPMAANADPWEHGHYA